MLGFGRQVSFGLAGWLWADLLLGLFAIFLAANAATNPATPQRAGVDPKPVEIRVTASGPALLSSDASTVTREQQRIAAAVNQQVQQLAPGRHVAIVFAYGVSGSPIDGDKMATVGTALLKDGAFQGSVVRAYHELAAGDPGSAIAFELYLNE